MTIFIKKVLMIFWSKFPPAINKLGCKPSKKLKKKNYFFSIAPSNIIRKNVLQARSI